MEFVKDYWGAIALLAAMGWGLIKTYFDTSQHGKEIAEMKSESKAFKKHVYTELESIHDKQVKATDKLTEVLNKLSTNMALIDQSNRHLSAQVQELKEKLP